MLRERERTRQSERGIEESVSGTWRCVDVCATQPPEREREREREQTLHNIARQLEDITRKL